MAGKTTQALAPDPSKISIVEKVLGAVAIFTFVSIWISSLMSPILLMRALWKEQYLWAGTIVSITVAAYAPWKKGFLAGAVHDAVYYYFPRYFKSISLEYEGETIEQKKENHQQTFYAIHPVGSVGTPGLIVHK